MQINDLSYRIRGAAFRVHQQLGPGLLESVYETVLKYELEKSGIDVLTQVPIPLIYEGITLELAFRMDMLVGETVVVEVKSVEALNEVHFKQVLTYLRLSSKPLGLLINFNVNSLEDKVSIKRIINGKL